MKLVRSLTVLLCLTLCLSAYGGEVKNSVSHVDAQEASLLLKQNADIQVLDVRTPQEFSEAHIAGAQNIDFRSDEFENKVGQLDPEKTYLVHCRSGGRSSKSLAKLKTAGIKNLIHLDGGILAWDKENLPLTATE